MGWKEEGETEFGISLQLDASMLGQPQTGQASAQTVDIPGATHHWPWRSVLTGSGSGEVVVSNIPIIIHSKKSLKHTHNPPQ